MATKKKQVFKVGDRVAERPKATMIPGLKAESRQKIAAYSVQRYGVVVDVYTKVSPSPGKRPVKMSCLKVLWDGMQTPSEHAQMRICHESELEGIREGFSHIIGG